MLRTFIAIDFPQDIVKKIDHIIEYFKTQTPKNALKWISTENLHLTIKFLGDIKEEELNQVKATLSEVLSGRSPFTLGVGGLGMYPNEHHPRVVWLGISQPDTLTDLYTILDSAFTSVGVDPEKRHFSPHVTIARVKQRSDSEVVKEIGETLSKFKVDSLGQFLIKEIILYKSVLTPKGPIYTPLTTEALYEV